MSRGRIISMTVSADDGYFVGIVDTGRVRVGQRGGACYEFPLIHPNAREAMALTDDSVRSFHKSLRVVAVPVQHGWQQIRQRRLLPAAVPRTR